MVEVMDPLAHRCGDDTAGTPVPLLYQSLMFPHHEEDSQGWPHGKEMVQLCVSCVHVCVMYVMCVCVICVGVCVIYVGVCVCIWRLIYVYVIYMYDATDSVHVKSSMITWRRMIAHLKQNQLLVFRVLRTQSTVEYTDQFAAWWV